jgi:hypothetical protein
MITMPFHFARGYRQAADSSFAANRNLQDDPHFFVGHFFAE